MMPTSDPTVISAAQAVGLAINYKRQVRLSRGLISADVFYMCGFICSADLPQHNKRCSGRRATWRPYAVLLPYAAS